MASTDAQTSHAALSKNVGAGSTVDFTTAKTVVTMVVIPTGTITGGQILVEASQDGTNWVPQHQMGVDRGVNRSCTSTRVAFRYWRSNIVAAVTGGGSITTTFMEAG